MIVSYTCARASRLGVTPRFEIPDVSPEDAPVAIRYRNNRYGYGDVKELHWHGGQLWESLGPNAVHNQILNLRRNMKGCKTANAQEMLDRIKKEHIAIAGVVHQEAGEPYWHLRSIHDRHERQRNGGKWYGLVLSIASRNYYSIEDQSFRADRLSEAMRFAERAYGADSFLVEAECEVLLPECLQIDPESEWWTRCFEGVTEAIRNAVDKAPPRSSTEIVAAAGDAIAEGIRQLIEKNGWSNHARMQLLAAITRGKE